jgi:broad specificity phosphatase PhoE
MRIFLLRHGQTLASLSYDPVLKYPNPALNELGKQQAALLGRRLQSAEIESIYSSDLKRTLETSAIIQGFIPCKLVVEPRFREIDMGQAPIQGWQAFPENYQEWQKHQSDLPYPEGESGTEVQKRAWPALTEILEQHHQPVAIVTHAGVIMVLISACLGLGMEQRFKMATPANCSLSTLVYDSRDGLLKVEHYNETAHLDELTKAVHHQ